MKWKGSPISVCLLALASFAPAGERVEALRFEENRGQAANGSRLLARAPGYTLSFEPSGVLMALGSGERVRLDWLGARAELRPAGAERLDARVHYLVGDDPSDRIRGVRCYRRVVYEDVYPGIDAVFYGTGRRLEFDFRVRPGADPDRIAFRLQGAPVALAEGGDLELRTASGRLELRAPVVYQETAGGERQRVEGRYALEGRRVGFRLGAFDRDRTLVIDPVVGYSTYLGGSDEERGLGAEVHGAGEAYLVGRTASSDFPTTPGGFAETASAGPDGFVSRLGSDGSLVFSTYVGGSGSDALQEVAVDAAGNVYFAGTSSSPDFPTTSGAFQTAPAGGSDVVVGKLSPDGSTLLFATYLGGSSSEGTPGIAVDAGGHVYVAGQVTSQDFPTTPGSFQPAHPSGALLFHTFVSKLDPTGTSLVYSTFVGGSGTGSGPGFDVAVDAAGHAYVTGFTTETDFPTTPGAFQTANAGGSCSTTNCSEAFVLKLSADGSSLVYSTYLGGTGNDSGRAIEVNAAGQAYVVGSTDAPDSPVAGGVQPALGGGFDAFVAGLSADGASLVFASFLGGSGEEAGRGLDLAASGAVLVSGRTDSSDFPLADPVQPAPGGGFDAFAARFAPAGDALSFGSYLGGVGFDTAGSVRAVPGGAVVAGYTESPDFPTQDPLQSLLAGTSDAFVARLTGFGPRAVEVDIRPLSDVNWIVPWLPAPIPVAVFSRDGFGAGAIDASSVRFGPGGAAALLLGRWPLEVDLDGDGERDAVFLFSMRETGIACKDGTAGLTGSTTSGASFQGEDAVRPIFCAWH